MSCSTTGSALIVRSRMSEASRRLSQAAGLLASKTATYPLTRQLLSVEELRLLDEYPGKIAPSLPEAVLMVRSALEAKDSRAGLAALLAWDERVRIGAIERLAQSGDVAQPVRRRAALALFKCDSDAGVRAFTLELAEELARMPDTGDDLTLYWEEELLNAVLANTFSTHELRVACESRIQRMQAVRLERQAARRLASRGSGAVALGR